MPTQLWFAQLTPVRYFADADLYDSKMSVIYIQEYDREPDDDWREKERAVEELVEKLDIVITDINPEGLSKVKFVDFYKMLEKSDDEEPICDFGVYVSEVDVASEAHNLDIKVGDLVLCLDDQDFLNSTAAKIKNYFGKLGKKKVTLTLGRNETRKEPS